MRRRAPRTRRHTGPRPPPSRTAPHRVRPGGKRFGGSTGRGTSLSADDRRDDRPDRVLALRGYLAAAPRRTIRSRPSVVRGVDAKETATGAGETKSHSGISTTARARPPSSRRHATKRIRSRIARVLGDERFVLVVQPRQRPASDFVAALHTPERTPFPWANAAIPSPNRPDPKSRAGRRLHETQLAVRRPNSEGGRHHLHRTRRGIVAAFLVSIHPAHPPGSSGVPATDSCNRAVSSSAISRHSTSTERYSSRDALPTTASTRTIRSLPSLSVSRRGSPGRKRTGCAWPSLIERPAA